MANEKYAKSLIVDGLKGFGCWPQIAAAINALKKPAGEGGWDWNPFDKDDDQLGTIAEIQNNIRLVKTLALEVVQGIETLTMAGAFALKSEEKLQAAAKIIANAIKSRLPFWAFAAKPFVQPVVELLISSIVDSLNKKFGKDWPNVATVNGGLTPDTI